MMVYQYRFLHVFMSLFFFYVLACLLSVSVYLVIVVQPLYFQIITNPYVWMLYAPGPLFVGMSFSLIFAGVVQWVYSCEINENKIKAKDTWGKDIVFELKDITSVRTFEIPFMPLSQVKLNGAKWSVWIPKSASLELIKNS